MVPYDFFAERRGRTANINVGPWTKDRDKKCYDNFTATGVTWTAP